MPPTGGVWIFTWIANHLAGKVNVGFSNISSFWISHWHYDAQGTGPLRASIVAQGENDSDNSEKDVSKKKEKKSDRTEKI